MGFIFKKKGTKVPKKLNVLKELNALDKIILNLLYAFH